MNEERQKINLLSKKDLEFSYFCGGGAGGQARNKVHSGVQIKHVESGAFARASDSRSLKLNKRSAFERLCKTTQMKFWLAKKLYEVRQEETIEETVAQEMTDRHLKYEVKNATGQWEEVSASYFDSETAKELASA